MKLLGVNACSNFSCEKTKYTIFKGTQQSKTNQLIWYAQNDALVVATSRLRTAHARRSWPPRSSAAPRGTLPRRPETDTRVNPILHYPYRTRHPPQPLIHHPPSRPPIRPPTTIHLTHPPIHPTTTPIHPHITLDRATHPPRELRGGVVGCRIWD